MHCHINFLYFVTVPLKHTLDEAVTQRRKTSCGLLQIILVIKIRELSHQGLILYVSLEGHLQTAYEKEEKTRRDL